MNIFEIVKKILGGEEKKTDNTIQGLENYDLEKNPKNFKVVGSGSRPQQAVMGASDQSVLSEDQIKQGLLKFNPETPLASQAGVLRQAMQLLAQNPKIDPMIALTVALRETGGGRDLRHNTRKMGGAYEGVNNPYNFRDTTREGMFVNYPDFKTAILGGYNPQYKTQSQGFVGQILNSPAYAKYRETGNIDDLNSVFTPQSDGNQPANRLTADMEKLKKYFQ